MDDGGRPKLMVVGSTMVDLMSYLEKVPAPGETVFGRSFSMGFGGKGANQAVMAALLGAKVSMVNCLATDIFGDLTKENFEKFGVDVSRVEQIEGTYSGAATVWVESDGQNRIVLGTGANEALSPEKVDGAFDALPAPDVVLCQFEIPQPAIVRAFERGREVGAINILNPAPGAPLDPRLPELTDWLIPNETEFAIIANLDEETADTATLSPVVARMAEDMGTSIVVTLGERGALLYEIGDDHEPQLVPTTAVEAVVDTTGAGDTFVGSFAYAVASAAASADTGFTDGPVRPARQAVEFACRIAASSVARPGTQTSFPRGRELEGYLREFASSSNSDESKPETRHHVPSREPG